MTKVLIDGDIVAYRAAAIIEADFWEVHKHELGSLYKFKETQPEHFESMFLEDYDYQLGRTLDKVEGIIDRILTDLQDVDPALIFLGPDECEVFLTGRDNFRYDVAKTHPYKGHRGVNKKPVLLSKAREYLVDKWGAEVSDGEEADDLIAKGATEYGRKCVVASADKDMLQLAGAHFNFNKGEWKFVDEFEGLTFFYTQILTGDNADNIIGLYNIGPKKADKILKGAETEEDLWKKTVEAYGGDIDRVIENARLLWLRRHDGEIWEPPEQRKQKEELGSRKLETNS